MNLRKQQQLKDRIEQLTVYIGHTLPSEQLHGMAITEVARLKAQLAALQAPAEYKPREPKPQYTHPSRCPECNQLLPKYQKKSERIWRMNKERNIL